MQSKNLVFAILSLFSFNPSLYPAIAQSTIISSTKGKIPIEKLSVSDEVLGYDGKKQELTVAKIQKITSEKIDAIYAIDVENETLRVSDDHLFFDPAHDTWVPAKELTTEHILVALTAENNQFIFSPLNILKVEKITKPTTIFEVELESPHTFFVTKSRILTHNFDK